MHSTPLLHHAASLNGRLLQQRIPRLPASPETTFNPMPSMLPSRSRSRFRPGFGAAVRAAIAVALILIVPVPARGQDRTSSPEPSETPHADRSPFELWGLIGQRVGGLIRVDTGDNVPLDVHDAGTLGGGVGWSLGERTALELAYFRQSTRLEDRAAEGPDALADATLEYLHAGGRLILHRAAVQPFVRAGLGVLRLRGDTQRRGATYPSLAVGGGVLVPLSPGFGLGVDMRFFSSLLGNGTRVPCPPSVQACLRTANDTVLLQMHLGAAFRLSF